MPARSQIDKTQYEWIENARSRIRLKKWLYYHFIFFALGILFIMVVNLFLKVGEEFQPFGYHWFVSAIILWGFLLLYHMIYVYIIKRFLGKEWQQRQLEVLVKKQQKKFVKLKNKEYNFSNKLNQTIDDSSIKKKQEITLIAAVSQNQVIGKDNQLIWHLSEDLKRFKELTSGHHIIMGRKTFESFPKPLPNRTHIVLTRQLGYPTPEGVLTANSLDSALELAVEDEQPFIIGGGEIYKEALDHVDKIELTRIHKDFEGDAFFPEIDHSIWIEVARKDFPATTEEDTSFSFITYIRNKQ